MVKEVSASAARPRRSKRKKKPLTPEARRQFEQLRTYWRENRKRAGLTQQKAADALGISRSAVEQYLQGKVPLNIKTMMHFSRLFQVRPQIIWKSTWPFTDLTSEMKCPRQLAPLLRVWPELRQAQKAMVLQAVCSAVDSVRWYRSRRR